MTTGVEGEVRYVGLVTRGIAFAADAAIINVVSLVVAAGATLIVSLLHLPHEIRKVIGVIGGVAYIMWAVGYFVGFWTATGQTPGDRMMQFRIVSLRGEKLGVRRALVRCVGLLLAALPLFAGYVLILFDSRRRGLQDRIANTAVIDVPELSLAQLKRQQRRVLAASTVDPAVK